MDDSLANLVSNLPPESFENLKRFFPDVEKFKLLLRKGVFPYDFFDGSDKLNETKLPPIEYFFSRLNDCGIEDEDYQHAENVWETFDMKTLGNIMMLALQAIQLNLQMSSRTSENST